MKNNDYSGNGVQLYIHSTWKSIIFFIFLSLEFSHASIGQRYNADSLKLFLQNTSPDSTMPQWLADNLNTYFHSRPDSCIFYSKEILDLARKSGRTKLTIEMLHFVGESSRILGDFPGSLKAQFEALELSREIKFKLYESFCLGFIGLTYSEFGDNRRALVFFHSVLDINRRISENNNELKTLTIFTLTNIGNAYDLLNMQDSALFYQEKALNSFVPGFRPQLKSLILTRFGNAYAHKGEIDSAMAWYDRGLKNCALAKDKVNIGRLQGKKAQLFFQEKKYDSALLYASNAYINNSKANQRPELLDMGLMLSRLYSNLNRYDSALFYQDLALAMKDSLYGPHKFKNLQTLLVDEQDRQLKAEQAQQRYRNAIRYGLLIAGVIGLILISTILLRKNRNKQKTNLQLIKENKEAQLQLLKAQVHPHFLFNTLNNIYSRAQKESPDSADMIMELAHILRYMLDETKHELVPLESELQLIADYINLEKMRYGEGLDLYISFPSNTADLYITPLLLLPFVENCFKHGTSKVLHHPWINFKIELEEDRLILKLMNGKNPAPAITNKRKGTGIDNAGRRLELLYPGNYELQIMEEDEVFVVNLRLKLVNKNTIATDPKLKNQNEESGIHTA